MTRSRAERLLAAAALLLVVLVAVGPAWASVVTTDLFIVPEGEPVAEDVYVAAGSGRVDGTIEGDLVIVTGDLVIAGTVRGDVLALASGRVEVTPTGRIEGALRVVARDVVVAGAVGDDLAATAAAVGVPGTVGRDLVTFGLSGAVEGSVGRDVRGRAVRLRIDGGVGRDVDVSVERLRVGPRARVGGDVLYRSRLGASIDPAARVDGETVRLPTRSNFVVGVVLTIAGLVGFLGFVVSGLLVLWILPHSGSLAAGRAVTRPGRTLLAGLAAVVMYPAVIVVGVVSLVGIVPVAILLALAAVAAIVGPVPAVTALGDRIGRGRLGLLGSFLLGSVVWRLAMMPHPFLGAVVYLVGLAWGTGAWLVAGWELRARPPGGSADA